MMFAMPTSSKPKRLSDAYRFPGFRPRAMVRGIFGDRKARVITLVRRSKKRPAARAGRCITAATTARVRRARDLSCGDTRDLSSSSRSGGSPAGAVAGEARAARLPGRQSRLHQALRLLRRPALSRGLDQGRGQGAATWTGTRSRTLEKQYMREQLRRAGHARAEGDRHRRDLDPQGAHLPHRGQRPRAAAPDLVRGRGSLRGRAWTSSSRVAGAAEERAGFAWR